MIKAIHITSSLSRLAGGLFESVRLLSQNLVLTDRVAISIMGVDDAHTPEDAIRWQPLTLKTHRCLGPARFAYAPGMCKSIVETQPDLLHLHGLWQYPAIATLKASQRLGCPYMVSAHGMLEPWALQNSALKKKLASLAFNRSVLRKAHCIRATSSMEVDSIRKVGLKNPIVLIPNGVELSPIAENHTTKPTRRALFLSRIHPKKGLVNLVKAWDLLRPKNWELVIIGPDECHHLAQLQSMVAAAGLEQNIHFPGEAWGEQRNLEYQNADLFVLPTYSENFGLVVAEALYQGVPVITTKGTPWQDLLDYRCGWWIEIGVEPLVAALTEALALPSNELREMGLRGRNMVTNKYAWPPIGEAMANAYEWMLGHREQPDFVIMP